VDKKEGMAKLEKIAEFDEEAMVVTGYEDAIVGFSWDGKVAYDIDKCVDILSKNDGMTYEEAVEFLEFNTFGAYVGEKTPIFIHTF